MQAELALYVIHGLLHLCGHDDHDEAGAAAMRERERHYLRQLGLPDVGAASRRGIASPGWVPLWILEFSCSSRLPTQGCPPGAHSTRGPTCSTFQRAPVCFNRRFTNCLIVPSISPLPIDWPRSNRKA